MTGADLLTAMTGIFAAALGAVGIGGIVVYGAGYARYRRAYRRLIEARGEHPKSMKC
ncbi:hypothetical protein [Azospirillum argentinense]